MDVIKKLSAGVPGTKRYLREYGDRLVCIRYRHDKKTPTRQNRRCDLAARAKTMATALPQGPRVEIASPDCRGLGLSMYGKFYPPIANLFHYWNNWLLMDNPSNSSYA